MTQNDLILEIMYNFDKQNEMVWFSLNRNKGVGYISLCIKKPLFHPFIIRIPKKELYIKNDVEEYCKIIRNSGKHYV